MDFCESPYSQFYLLIAIKYLLPVFKHKQYNQPFLLVRCHPPWCRVTLRVSWGVLEYFVINIAGLVITVKSQVYLLPLLFTGTSEHFRH